MTAPKSALALAEQHVREGRSRVRQQLAVVADLERGGHTGHILDLGRQTLAALSQTLDLARECHKMEQAKAAQPPYLAEGPR